MSMALLLRNCFRHHQNSQLLKKLPHFPTTKISSQQFSSSTALRLIFRQFGPNSNFGISTKLFFNKNRQIGRAFIDSRIFISKFLRGSGRSFRLIGLSAGLLGPSLIRFAKCQQPQQQNGGAEATIQIEDQIQGIEPDVIWAEFWDLIGPYLGWLVVAIAATAVGAVISIQIGGLLSQLLANLTQLEANGADGFDFDVLKEIVMKLTLAAAGQALTSFVCKTSVSMMSQGMEKDLRALIYSEFIDFPPKDSKNICKDFERLTLTVSEFKHSFTQCTTYGLSTLANSVFCLLNLYLMGAGPRQLTFSLLKACAAVGAIAYYSNKLLRQQNSHPSYQAQAKATYAMAYTSLHNIRVNKFLTKEEELKSSYNSELEKTRLLGRKLCVRINGLNAISKLVQFGPPLAMLYGFTQMLAARQIVLNDVLTSMMGAMQIQSCMAKFWLVFENFVKAWNSFYRIVDFLQQNDEKKYKEEVEISPKQAIQNMMDFMHRSSN